MQRLTLERRQVWVYLAAIAAGMLMGSAFAGAGPALEALLWPALGLLLYITFLQVPLLHLRAAFTDHRFLAATVIGNFIVIPALVFLLISWLPADPVLRLGVLLVLLVPCTDWFISFSQLGGGDVPRAIAITPLNLLLQLLLLPVYLWAMTGPALTTLLSPADLWPALVVVLLPLLAAAMTERWLEARPGRAIWREKAAWWPVPLLAVVVFLIAGAQVDTARDTVALLPVIVPLFAAFLLLAAVSARIIATAMILPTAQGRTLAFSLGTRNSFLVLPVALALPAGMEIAAVVIVVQSLVELFGMMFYLWWVPRRLFR